MKRVADESSFGTQRIWSKYGPGHSGVSESGEDPGDSAAGGEGPVV